MRGLEPRRTRYAGTDFVIGDPRRRYKSGGTSAPKAVDPSALAQAQVQANLQTAQAQSALNNVRTTSPLGTSFFEQDPTGRWNLTQALNESTAPVYTGQTGLAAMLANLGQGAAQWGSSPAQNGAELVNNALRQIGPAAYAPRADLQTRLDFSGLGTLPSSTQDFGEPIKRAEQAAYDTAAGFLDPQFANKRADLRQQLADQGIGIGNAAYSRALDDLGRQETLAYKQAQDAAVQAGQQEQARLFSEELGARQQGASEIGTAGQFRNAAEQQVWQDPLTALASLAGTGTGVTGSAASDLATLNPLSGFEWAGALPTFGGSPTAVSPANVVGAGQVAAQNAANRFTAANTLNNQLFNGLGTLGGALGLGNGGLGSTISGLFGGAGSLFGPALDVGGVAQTAAGLGAATGLDAGTLALIGLI